MVRWWDAERVFGFGRGGILGGGLVLVVGRRHEQGEGFGSML